MSVKQQVASLYRVSNIVKVEGLKHWIDFGTLLGAVREAGFLNTDVDFDIGPDFPDTV